MRIDKRLKVISGQIGPGESFADIGSDHGYVAFDQYRKGNRSRIIISDISPKALENAVRTCMDFGPDARCGDGLEVIEKGEVDDIVIAGMGGLLIGDILTKDKAKTLSFKRIILQPRNNEGHVRWLLNQLGMEITADILVREGRYICPVITSIPAGKPASSLPEGDILWSVPAMIHDKALFSEYIGRMIAKKEKIRNGMLKGSIDTGDISYEIDRLKEVLKNAEE